jgi:small subunit ribosomal protein S3
VGHKTHPRGLRLGIIETWDSKWYHEKDYAKWLHEDLKIQNFVKERLSRAGISRIEIERVGERCSIHIHTARPGIVIGRRGVEAEKLQADLERLVGRTVRINVAEIKRPELDAQLVAEVVALQIGRRTNFRQAMKKNIAASMKAGAQGVKMTISGLLGGAEMARTESNIEGRVPLHTLRANIDYGFAEANTTYGKIGVKVWLFKGEVIGAPPLPALSPPSRRSTTQVATEATPQRRQPRRPFVRRDGRNEAGSTSRSGGRNETGSTSRSGGRRGQQRSGGGRQSGPQRS